jgi:hypothetical protein
LVTLNLNRCKANMKRAWDLALMKRCKSSKSVVVLESRPVDWDELQGTLFWLYQRNSRKETIDER